MSSELDFRNTTTLRLLRALVEAHDSVQKAAETQIRESSLTAGEFDCLATLGEAGCEMRMCDLAERSLTSRSRATQVVRQLVSRRLVLRRRSPESEREVLVSLTPAGAELFARVYPDHCRFLRSWFGDRLPVEDQEALIGLLRRIHSG